MNRTASSCVHSGATADVRRSQVRRDTRPVQPEERILPMRRFRLTMVAAVLVLAGMVGAADATRPTTTARLQGSQEVPAADTDARGQLVMKVARDGESIAYRLIVANIDDVQMAHLHMAPAGQNGGVVVWLYPDGPPPQLIPGRTNGILATGTITGDDLVGSMAGMDIGDLLDAIDAGNIYVNVHTTAFPGGEVRGQVG